MIEKWTQWLRNNIAQELIRLQKDRTIYLKIGDIVAGDKHYPEKSIVYNFLAYTYGSTIAAGIRRQLDIDKDCISLAKILLEIQQNVRLIKRTNYVSIDYKNKRDPVTESWVKTRLNKEFTRMAGRGDYIDQQIIDRDFNKLDKVNNVVVRKITAYTDRFIAHQDKRQKKILDLRNVPVFKELHLMIDTLQELFEKYHLLITGGGYDIFDDLNKKDIENEVATFFTNLTINED